jgi:hypothetical protein
MGRLTMSKGVVLVGLFALIAGCNWTAPSDEELEVAAKLFEKSETIRIKQKYLEDPDPNGFSDDDEVEGGSR